MKKIGRLVKAVKTSAANPRNGEGSFIRLKDGGIMLAYSHFGGTGNDHDRSRLMCILSYDEGESWSEARELFNDDQDSRNNMAASFVRLPNGELGLCYFRKSDEADGTIACMPVFRYSRDEGKTWSRLVFCTQDTGYYCGTNHASIVTNAGRIVTPVAFAGSVHRYDLSPGVIRFFCSDDCGRSWQETLTPISSPYGDRYGLQEPGLMELSDGRLWCHMRTAYGFQYQSLSLDGGVTWSVPEPNLLFPSPDAPMRVKRFGEKTIALFNPLAHSQASAYRLHWGSPPRTPLVLALSANDGADFARPVSAFSYDAFNEFCLRCFALEDDPADSFCYPAMIRTKDGFLVTYYCDGGSNWVLNYSRILKIHDSEIEVSSR